MEQSSEDNSYPLSLVPAKQEDSCTSITETVSATTKLHIRNYHQTKGIGIGKCITSSNFSVGGYNWCLDYYPDGKYKAFKDYISLFIRPKSAVKRDIKAEVSFLIVDKNGYSFSRTRGNRSSQVFSNYNNVHGEDRFVKRSILEYSKRFLPDDCCTIDCFVSVEKSSSMKVRKANPIVVQSSNLGKQLCQFLDTGDQTDITFEVGEETFQAHKCVLAARSPVFRVELYGPMKERNQKAIKVADIEVPVFKALLRFIYSDSLDELKETMKVGDTDMAQHLLVAADRYGVGRLKTFCESKLYENMEVHNVATTLALADQHNCFQLKEACLNFISPPEMLAAVVQTDGFKHLMRSCPLILKELYDQKRGDDMQEGDGK